MKCCKTPGCRGRMTQGKTLRFANQAGKTASVTPWHCLRCAEEWVDDADIERVCRELEIPLPPTHRSN